MALPLATAKASWDGYEHLHADDQPYVGVNGLTHEQALWYHFELELTLRKIHASLYVPQTVFSLEAELDRLDHIVTVDR